jgi:alkylation response protein AidB-like acyl-CoA dehydrogenase
MENTMTGGSFLLGAPARIFAPEQFTPEHREIARATDEFFRQEVEPNLEAILHQDWGVLRSVIQKSAEVGLVSTLIPEEYGGLDMDLASAMIVTEGVAHDASYASSHGGQAGIGALPVSWFGTDDQKRRYLNKLVTAEFIGAYCLTEPQAGSDAMNARTRAELTADGKHYVLNGQKMWITNAGFADLFIVFAKVDGEKFTCFLVERSWPGVSIGAEEKKMGLKGASTSAVYFDNVHVPVENVLGEVGRGHVVAFNTLNLGRLKLALFAHGESKEALVHSLRYARERKAFGKSIGEFGLIQQKLADMAARMFANESTAYRITGHIQDLWSSGKTLVAALEEFAIECSLAKILGSETLDFVVDEAVQIHGGYGYHQDYAVERAYRDARIYRIFEGTNEINRMVATTTLLKRARGGRIALADAVKQMDSGGGKRLPLFLLGAAYEKFGGAIEEQQEVAGAITDVMMYTFAIESAQLRAQQSKSELQRDLAAVFAEFATHAMLAAGRLVLGACGVQDIKGLLTLPDPINTMAARRRIASRLLDAGKYTV